MRVHGLGSYEFKSEEGSKQEKGGEECCIGREDLIFPKDATGVDQSKEGDKSEESNAVDEKSWDLAGIRDAIGSYARNDEKREKRHQAHIEEVSGDF